MFILVTVDSTDSSDPVYHQTFDAPYDFSVMQGDTEVAEIPVVEGKVRARKLFMPVLILIPSLSCFGVDL